jgi:hypothetical protein
LKRKATLERLRYFLELPAGTGWRRLLLVGAALFAASVVVTLIIVLPGRRAAPQRETPAAASVEPAGELPPVSLEDFLLPPAESPAEAAPYLLRNPQPRWSQEQVDRYWVPPRQIVTELLARENDRAVGELLEEVP